MYFSWARSAGGVSLKIPKNSALVRKITINCRGRDFCRKISPAPPPRENSAKIPPASALQNANLTYGGKYFPRRPSVARHAPQPRAARKITGGSREKIPKILGNDVARTPCTGLDVTDCGVCWWGKFRADLRSHATRRPSAAPKNSTLDLRTWLTLLTFFRWQMRGEIGSLEPCLYTMHKI